MENDATTDVGLDAAFLQGRITFTADAYYKKLTNLYTPQPNPGWNGGTPTSNTSAASKIKASKFALGGTTGLGRQIQMEHQFHPLSCTPKQSAFARRIG